jgi:hypothetical protein
MNNVVLSKVIRNNFDVYKFASKMLWSTIGKALQVKMSFAEIESYLKSDIDVSGQDITVNKSGIDIDLAKVQNFRQFFRVLQLNHVKFFQIMGALYKFTYDTKFITFIVRADSELQQLILEKFRLYFAAPSSFTFEDLEQLIKESKGEWFIPWLITYTTSQKQNLVRHNLNYDADYVREWVRGGQGIQYVNACANELLKSDVSLCSTYKNVEMIKGNSHYKPVQDGIFENLMKKYGREVIAGPSGSSIMTYQLVFNILKILSSEKDKIMLLLCLVGDYYPIHHSIPEILILYPEEASLPKYDLSMDPVAYIQKLAGKYIPELYYYMAFSKMDCDEKYFESLEVFLDLILKQTKYQPDLVQISESGVRSCKPLSLENCQPDNYHPDSEKIQVLLGRFNLTSQCFTGCPNYYIFNVPIWSIFRNDLFIRYIASSSKNSKFDSVFPIRILLSNNPEFFIPPHNMRIVKHIQLLIQEYFTFYTWDENEFQAKNQEETFTDTQPKNYPQELEKDVSLFSPLLKNDNITKSITDYPSSNIISRELCLLRKLHFYMVLKNKIYLPFILVSHMTNLQIYRWYAKRLKTFEGQIIEIR